MHKPPKKVRDAVDSLLSWMENTDHSFNEGVLRFIASFPQGAEELEDVGYEPSIPLMGWREFSEIEKLMKAIETRDDVEYLVGKLIGRTEEDY